MNSLYAQLYLLADTILDRGDIGYNPSLTDENQVVGSIMNTVYLVAGVVAVIVIVIAGYIFVVSRGDSARIAQARKAILAAVIGLVIVIAAFTITQFIIRGVNSGV